ncbi:MAG: 4-(cytidine 5'-diphospho)-2-C-methyl-D-erythritol kinase [Alphaproteobacteria bacterium HGW-Alphaproteobacteria-2]|nr:MAG: 4-(cytidine 5'-diphospho)-2-C-methyl-D-erythritol kinase [Alphaproteobacteria bacterium HGW-Alphaproteobacteria-2]
MQIDEPAPAKLNLALHVTGRRADGYHLLDSLVAFCSIGDVVSLHDVPGAPPLTVSGRFADGLDAGPENLVRRALALGGADGLSATLEKRLPVASGIGGGSADAAATLRALARLRGVPTPPPEAVLALGADVPVCLAGRPARLRGIGGRLSPVPALPPVWTVLANPGIAVATPEVFRALASRENLPLPEPLPAWSDAAALAAWLAGQRNDLEAPACALAPAIVEVRAALAAMEGCLLARMSGSGATCFGLFAAASEAEAAARRLCTAHPRWWVEAGRILS